MSTLASQRYFLPTSGTRIVLPAPECNAAPRARRGVDVQRAARMALRLPAAAREEHAGDARVEARTQSAVIPLPWVALPEPDRAAQGRDAPPRWTPLLAGMGLLLLVLGAWGWSRVQHELAVTRAALEASQRRLAQAEDRQSAQGAAIAERLQRELGELREQARSEVRTLGADVQSAEAARNAATQARLGALERQVQRRLADEQSAARAAWNGHDAQSDPEGVAAQRIFAQARQAIVFIRTAYRVRLIQTGEEQEMSSYGTGFLISPSGVAVTAQHVLYPWRYDRRLRTSESLGLAEVIDNSVAISVWLADSQVTPDSGDDRPYLSENAYRRDAGHASVRILHTGNPVERTELIMSAMGPTAVTMPRVGNGDLAVFQLIDAGRTFPALALAAVPPPQALDAVLVLGFPLSRLQDGRAIPQASLGRVRRAGGELLELDAAVHPGNSGGPILDREGRVIGMASAILETPIYGLAMPVEPLLAAWRTVREETARQQRRLQALGCDPGAVDGIPGARTLEAQRCAAALATGL